MRLVGIINDYNHKSFRKRIEPTIIAYNPGMKNRKSVLRIKTDNIITIHQTINYIEDLLKKYAPTNQRSFYFLDEKMDNLYSQVKQFQVIFTFFSILAIFIACLGLYGLILFAVDHRTKEIGIRKVFGASIINIVLKFNNEFIKWIILANLIAWPIARYSMKNWLQHFAYRIDITVWPFLLAGLSTLLIALLTVSWQAIRAAMANPVESLRYE
jgi:putative ABC transport system permease protein